MELVVEFDGITFKEEKFGNKLQQVRESIDQVAFIYLWLAPVALPGG
jgi:hypothetical protein